MIAPDRVAAVLLAGGSGSRLGGEVNKVFLPVAGRAVLSWSLHWMHASGVVGTYLVVARPVDLDEVAALCRAQVPGVDVELVAGGASRHHSERNGIEHLADRIGAGSLDVVLVHDAARPVVLPALIRRVVEGAVAAGGALPVLPAHGLLSSGDGGAASAAGLARAQTPQAFRARPLLAAYRAADREGFVGTDTSACFERYGEGAVQSVVGDPRNVKVTYPSDLTLVDQLLHRQ